MFDLIGLHAITLVIIMKIIIMCGMPVYVSNKQLLLCYIYIYIYGITTHA